MRITVLCTDLGVRVPGEKGASMHLLSITRAFAAIGHDVQLVGVSGHGCPPDDLADVCLLPHPGRAEGLQRERNKLEFVERVVAGTTDRVRDFAPDFVYERLALFGSAGTRIVRAVEATRHVVEVNALLAEEEARWRGLHLATQATDVERDVLSLADHVVAVSAEVAADVTRVAPTTACTVVENGAEVERFAVLPEASAARRRLGLPQQAPLACFVGALRPWHGVDLAVRAIALSPHLHLAVVGDGPVRIELETLAADLGVARRVHFLGQRAHDEVVAALAASDVAVAPYPPLDGFSFSPLKLYEYLASGTPVVASAIGQIPEALGHGAFGTLVTPGDEHALASAMDAAVSDPHAILRAEAGRAHALRSHGWTDRARRIVEIAQVTRALA